MSNTKKWYQYKLFGTDHNSFSIGFVMFHRSMNGSNLGFRFKNSWGAYFLFLGQFAISMPHVKQLIMGDVK